METNENKDILTEFYANNLIDNLGRKYSCTSMYDYSATDNYYGEYDGYGLEIEASYHDNTYTNPYISIKFNEIVVYNSKYGILLKGSWQKILSELYEKIPVILYYREENHKRVLHAQELYENYIRPLYERVRKINENIRFSAYEEYDKFKEFKSTTYHKTVIYNDEIVLDIIDKIWNTSVYKYTPREWENDIIDFHNKYILSETEEEKIRAEKELEKIRKMSKYY